MAVELLQRLVTEAALGGVVDALERQVVLRGGDDAQVRERVADFGAFVEAEAADDLVGQADLDEAVFEFARLERGAHEDGDAVQGRAFAFEALDLLTHAAGFLRAIPHADDADLVAAIDLGPQVLAEALAVFRDDPASRRQNVRGGAVVLLQPDHLGAGKILFEAQDIGDFCAAP